MSKFVMFLSRQCFRLGKFLQRFSKQLDATEKSIDDCYKELFG